MHAINTINGLIVNKCIRMKAAEQNALPGADAYIVLINRRILLYPGVDRYDFDNFPGIPTDDSS